MRKKLTFLDTSLDDLRAFPESSRQEIGYQLDRIQQGFSQAQAASALGVTQPRISELARGKIQIFSIDKLITMMAHAGLHIQRIVVQYPHAA